MFIQIKKVTTIICSAVLVSTLAMSSVWADSAQDARILAARDKMLENNSKTPKTVLINKEPGISDQKIIDVPNGSKLITAPNGTRFIKPAHGTPYCVKGCDLTLDCNANEPAPPKNMTWKCNNKPGFCIGNCYLKKAK